VQSTVVQKLVIDADPGIGDALAIVLALRDPAVEVVGLTATGGRVSGQVATRNLQALIDCLDPSRLPRIGHSSADSSPLLQSPSLDGPLGLGDWDVPVVELHHRHESARVLVEIVRDRPHEITLLTLGPLTNVALASEMAADFFDLLGGLVCLGGSIEVGGDVTAVAEFNVMAGAESARRVLTSPISKTLVPLDVSGRVVLSPDQSRRLRERVGGRLAELLDAVLPFWFRMHHETLGIEGVLLHGVAALAAVTQPRLLSRTDMLVDVELAGQLTRGMTVLDRRREMAPQANVSACVDIEVQGVIDYLSRLMATEG
jgi:inosine-uridine nucleoside N-ribohydrolase